MPDEKDPQEEDARGADTGSDTVRDAHAGVNANANADTDADATTDMDADPAATADTMGEARANMTEPRSEGSDSIERFAADLRRLRLDADSPTYQRLQNETGISRSVLSEAFGGRQLPSARTVDRIVRACGGDPGQWIGRRESLLAGRPRGSEAVPTEPAVLPATDREHAGETFGATPAGVPPASPAGVPPALPAGVPPASPAGTGASAGGGLGTAITGTGITGNGTTAGGNGNGNGTGTGTADPTTGTPDTAATDDPATASPASAEILSPAAGRRRWAWFAGGAGIGVAASALVVVLVVTTGLLRIEPAPRGNQWQKVAVETGTNPGISPCLDDARVATSAEREGAVLEILWSYDCFAAWGRLKRQDDRYIGNTIDLDLYVKGDPEGPLRQVSSDADAQSAYTFLIVRPDPDTQICVEGSYTVGEEVIDLGQPLCS